MKPLLPQLTRREALRLAPSLELHAGSRPVRAAAPGGKPVEEITG